MARNLDDTALHAETLADLVCREAAFYLGCEAPFACADALADKARAVYAAREGFARAVDRGDGRETLRSFMRHWLCGELRRRHPTLRLPNAFANGMPLPAAR